MPYAIRIPKHRLHWQNNVTVYYRVRMLISLMRRANFRRARNYGKKNAFCGFSCLTTACILLYFGYGPSRRIEKCVSENLGKTYMSNEIRRPEIYRTTTITIIEVEFKYWRFKRDHICYYQNGTLTFGNAVRPARNDRSGFCPHTYTIGTRYYFCVDAQHYCHCFYALLIVLDEFHAFINTTCARTLTKTLWPKRVPSAICIRSTIIANSVIVYLLNIEPYTIVYYV